MYACAIDGKLVPTAQAAIPVNDHGFLYGDGVFEGLRFYHRKIFREPEHLVRLFDSARALAIDVPMTQQAVSATMAAAIEASCLEDGYIRLVVTRGSGPMGIDPTTCSRPRVIAIVDELTMVPEEKRRAGINCIVASTRRLACDQIDPRVKSLNYLNQIMARLEAQAAGAEEAIILNREGRVAEGTADNVFIVKRGRLITPPVTEGALEGVTRNTIIELARQAAIDVEESPLGVYDLFTADECFLTGTGAELIAVASISGRRVSGAGPVFRQLEHAFFELVRGPARVDPHVAAG